MVACCWIEPRTKEETLLLQDTSTNHKVWRRNENKYRNNNIEKCCKQVQLHTLFLSSVVATGLLSPSSVFIFISFLLE